MALNSIEELVADIRAGRMVVVMDDEDRENEGDLIMAACHVRPDDINFMITHARGLVCLTLTEEKCQTLNLTPMARKNGTKYGTAFTQSIEAAEGVTTGISPADRAHTILTAISPTAKASDIVQPGHVFPIMARKGGVLHRAGHTETGCDLARLAGLEPAAVICEITNADGTMARRDDLEIFAQRHGLKIGTVADLIKYRMLHEKTIEPLSQEPVNTEYGPFMLHRFQELGTPHVHLAMVKGSAAAGISTVRVHSFRPLRDGLGIIIPETPSWTLPQAMRTLADSEHGVLVWISNHEPLQLEQSVTPKVSSTEAHYRNIGTGAQILRELGVQKMRLLSSPLRFNALSGFGLEVVDYVAPHNVTVKP